MTPEEFITYHVKRITTEEALKARLALFFPLIQYTQDIIPGWNGNEQLHVKQADGLGTFLYYSSRGKMCFHEYVLDIMCKSLKERHIKYSRPHQKRGADLVIGKWHVELETRANPPKQPERRQSLIRRARQHQEYTLIVVLNETDKHTYKHTPLRDAITGNHRFLTVKEFMAWQPR